MDDFFAGLKLMTRGISEAIKQASFGVGFGCITFGTALVLLERYSITGAPAYLISFGAFATSATLGLMLDRKITTRRRTSNTKASLTRGAKKMAQDKKRALQSIQDAIQTIDDDGIKRRVERERVR